MRTSHQIFCVDCCTRRAWVFIEPPVCAPADYSEEGMLLLSTVSIRSVGRQGARWSDKSQNDPHSRTGHRTGSLDTGLSVSVLETRLVSADGEGQRPVHPRPLSAVWGLKLIPSLMPSVWLRDMALSPYNMQKSVSGRQRISETHILCIFIRTWMWPCVMAYPPETWSLLFKSFVYLCINYMDSRRVLLERTLSKVRICCSETWAGRCWVPSWAWEFTSFWRSL